jgi:hypothetical protein
MTSAPPPPEVAIEGIRARPPGDPALAVAAFLGGCWRGLGPDERTVLEERWTPPEAGLMLGVTRRFRDGRVLGFAFARIESDPSGIHYRVHGPDGRVERDLRLAGSQPGRLVFEPTAGGAAGRLLYTSGDGGLVVHLEGAGGEPRPERWTLARIPCD